MTSRGPFQAKYSCDVVICYELGELLDPTACLGIHRGRKMWRYWRCLREEL